MRDQNTPFEGIHRLKLPLTGSALKYVNAYILAGEDGHLLIDTGWKTKDSHQALKDQLQALDLDPADISHILITHAHIDHYGLAETLKRQTGASLSMHTVEQELVSLRYRHALDFADQSNDILRRGGMADTLITDPQLFAERFAKLTGIVDADHVYKGDETISHQDFEFQVLWTPGHSPGHICLYDARHKLFFSGDHILPGITPNVGLSPRSGPNPLGDYVTSLKRIRDLEVGLVLPAHGPPFGGFNRRVNQIIDHHQVRNSEILQLLADPDAIQTPFELVSRMRWYSKGRVTNWHQLPSMDQRLAMFEVMSHLADLECAGTVITQNGNGIVSYGLANALPPQ